MAGVIKSIIRFGLIGGLVAGGAILVAGPHRAMALFHQARAKMVGVIDNAVDDPVALRAQLRELEAKYPQRISQVRAQLADIQEEIRQVERERKVSQRVVDLASADLTNIQSLIARAKAVKEQSPYRTVSVRWDDRPISLDQAYAKANYIAAAVKAYQARSRDAERNLQSLRHEQEQLEALLSQLEQEQLQFQAQLFQLDSQIDAVARKERLVQIMQDRQKRLDQLSRYEVASLDQFRARLAKKHAELDAKIDLYTRGDAATNYEHKAQFQIDTESSAQLREDAVSPALELPSSIVEPDESCEDDAPDAIASSSGAVVIE